MRKKILYLAHRIPYPPNKGDKIRAYNEVKYLAESHAVDLLCLADNPDDIKYKESLQQLCRQVKVFPLNTIAGKIRGVIGLVTGRTISEAYFYKKAFQSLFDLWVFQNNYDAIICFSSPMAEYVFKSTALNRLARFPELIMDFCDLDSDKWVQYSRTAPFPMNLVYGVEGKRLLNYETKINLFFDRSVFVSEIERDLFISYFPDAKKLEVIPNGVDYDYFSPEESNLYGRQEANQPPQLNSQMLMFSGAMDYHANKDGVKWFCREILPLIRKAFPNVTFYIVGSNPAGDIRQLAQEKSVVVTGFVEDIREYYRAADICVIPLCIARGVQNKVLEAMSTAKPVVTTSIAVQGIGAIPGRDLIVEDNPRAFAQAVIDLLHDRGKMAILGENGRGYVLKHHDWNKNLAGLVE
ncbi:MAG: TIGR03087 family PEP-CTERM/XrtA system glycosyltransferase [Desulfamplus sp.]|nr:TIGR03087 family PEP-CTERM/XrtA system glycosyltransferase [Desulfamplus sp.]